eukprot:8167933-Pyramimonas_sp.AAC.1
MVSSWADLPTQCDLACSDGNRALGGDGGGGGGPWRRNRWAPREVVAGIVEILHVVSRQSRPPAWT